MLIVVEEAGGQTSDMRGGPTPRSGVETVASNGHIHAQLIELLGLA